MEELPAAQLLLAGPRGRELCLDLARSLSPGFPAFSCGSSDPLPRGLGQESKGVLQVLGALPQRPGITVAQVLQSLDRVVKHASYWQPPSDSARVLAEPEVRDLLLPVAVAVVRARPQWWLAPGALTQYYVQWIASTTVPGTDPPTVTGSAAGLRRWRESISAEEGNTPLVANWTGRWWSVPALSDVPVTTPAIPENGPAGLRMVEDPLPWTTARTFPLRAAEGSRIYEIREARSWQDLVSAYPLEVTRSRGRSWAVSSGNAEADTWFWAIPDWQAVARDYDGVHLSVAGYLRTAGSVLDAAGVKTMLAGWAPAETWWLNDVLVPAGDPATWTATPGHTGWQVQAGAAP
ncbi:hypothetical protein ITX31_14730 [Arthrobacter gandavensis]|uniref:hypothetical protein n=1 Tax=Arthrobacter gandavensis TaxID=169960 RepID=UPI00188EF6D8|nr:hypothetical protein [Arthrobacter gandavensis]MBF4995358.1 hypothetical protein [Arthrobacter gandavensis]